jgi:hypothetical protein
LDPAGSSHAWGGPVARGRPAEAEDPTGKTKHSLRIGWSLMGLRDALRAQGKTSEAIKKLIGLQPKKAIVVRDDLEIELVTKGNNFKGSDKADIARKISGSKFVDDLNLHTLYIRLSFL